MDGMTGVFVGIVSKVAGLGIDHAFSEIAASGKHKRELEALDHQLERTAAIARAQGGSAPIVIPHMPKVSPAPTVSPRQDILIAVKPAIRQQEKPLSRPASACQIAEDVEPLEMPTTDETITALKERLVKELYRVELDLQGGGRIAGKPCDCLSKRKHTSGIEATAEELMSYDKSPLYGNIITWFKVHAPEFEPAEITKHEPAYYQALTPEIRNFRKQLNGDDYGYTLDYSKDPKKLPE